jgi:cytosine/adenosine deaminase-related metal-dependent hydrolase
LQADQFLRERSYPIDVRAGPPKVDPHVAAVGPTKVRKRLRELDYGFRPSLSTDHPVNITQDAFSLMRANFMFQRWQVLDRARKGEQNLPPLLTSRDLLEFATIGGAQCANIDDKVGTLSSGKEADIVMLRADQLGLWPLSNAAGAVVNQANPGHVENVFIAGKVRKWRGKLVGVDTARVLRIAQESRDAVLRRANF